MRLPIYLLAACFCSTAFGGIEWEQTEVAMRAKPGDDHVEAVFRFKNTGAKPVMLKDAQPTCDCLNVNAELRAYAPGEGGTVEVTFYVEHHLGENRKGVAVLTDDPAQPQRELFLTVFVGDTLSITPAALNWRAGGERDAQSLHVVVTREKPLRIVSAACEGAGWKAVVREVKAGREYFVNVTPPEAGARASSVLTLKTDADAEHAKVFTAGLSVE